MDLKILSAIVCPKENLPGKVVVIRVRTEVGDIVD